MSLSFTQLEQELAEAPPTWVPALLRALVRRAGAAQVFQPGGLVHFVTDVVDEEQLRPRSSPT